MLNSRKKNIREQNSREDSLQNWIDHHTTIQENVKLEGECQTGFDVISLHACSCELNIHSHPYVLLTTRTSVSGPITVQLVQFSKAGRISKLADCAESSSNDDKNTCLLPPCHLHRWQSDNSGKKACIQVIKQGSSW